MKLALSFELSDLFGKRRAPIAEGTEPAQKSVTPGSGAPGQRDPKLPQRAGVRTNIDLNLVNPAGAFTTENAGSISTGGPYPDLNQPAFDGRETIIPGVPRQVMFPQGVFPKVWDYNAYQNVRQPRGTEQNAFSMFRQIRDANDIVGSCVLSRKNEMRKKRGKFVPNDRRDRQNSEIVRLCEESDRYWEVPDPLSKMPADQWDAQLVEEALVTDAVCIAPVYTGKGDVAGFVQVDGTTITPLIDEFGFLPRPPYAAYQQWIRGTPRGSYTTEDIYYRPMNVTIDSVYGKPPVETVLTTVVTGIRRWIHNLTFYTEGSIPYVWVALPEGTAPEQFEIWVEAFNKLYSGNDAERMKLQILPPGADPKEIRPAQWSREQDEWIARVICAAFGVSPVPYVAMINRATAQVMTDVQVDTCQASLERYLASIKTDLNRLRMKADVPIHYEFTYDKTDVSEERARSLQTLWSMGAISSQYVHEEILGLDPDQAITEMPLGPLANKPEIAPMLPSLDMGGPVGVETESQPSAPVDPNAAAAITFNELTLALERVKSIGDEVMVNAIREAMAARLGQPAPAPIEVLSEPAEEVAVAEATADVKTGTEPTTPLAPEAEAELGTLKRYLKKNGPGKVAKFKPEHIPAGTFRAIVSAVEAGESFDAAVSKAKTRPGLVRARSLVYEATLRYLKAQAAENIVSAVEEFERRKSKQEGADAPS